MRHCLALRALVISVVMVHLVPAAAVARHNRATNPAECTPEQLGAGLRMRFRYRRSSNRRAVVVIPANESSITRITVASDVRARLAPENPAHRGNVPIE
jgi:hypothetical protein